MTEKTKNVVDAPVEEAVASTTGTESQLITNQPTKVVDNGDVKEPIIAVGEITFTKVKQETSKESVVKPKSTAKKKKSSKNAVKAVVEEVKEVIAEVVTETKKEAKLAEQKAKEELEKILRWRRMGRR